MYLLVLVMHAYMQSYTINPCMSQDMHGNDSITDIIFEYNEYAGILMM